MGKRDSTVGNAVRRTAAQGRALVEQWRLSGESVTEFCRGQAVGAQVLRYWLSRETPRKESGATARGFYVVSAAQKEREGESVASASSSGAAGGRPGGAVIVVLPAVTSAELVRTLRGLLEEVRT